MNAKELVEQLKKASEAYYNTGETIISDEEYDLKVEQLRKLDPTNEFLLTVGSVPIGTTYKHIVPIGSQEKLHDRKEFDAWLDKIFANDATSTPIVMQHKYDGITIVLYYQEGILKRALSRGDGYEGEDITTNVLKMENVKKTLPLSEDGIPFSGQLRGEIMLNISKFNKHFKPVGYKNPRNTVSGMSRDQKGNDLVKHFHVVYHDCVNCEEFTTEKVRSDFVNNVLQLKYADTFVLPKDKDAIWNHYLKIQEERQSLDFEIDGVIVRANSIGLQNEMGTSSDLRPKGQRCIKFPPLGAVTKLLKVHFTIGHTGAIIPNGILKPVEIGGVTVTNVLLNNFEEIERLKIAVNDDVRVIRAGDVIPKVVGLVKEAPNRQKIVVPTKCHVCGSTLVKDGTHIFCKNENCTGSELRRLKTYITKREIKFIGDELLAELYNKHDVKKPHNLYKLTEEYLAKIPRGNGVVGTLSKQIMAELNKSKNVSLQDFIGSLGIVFIGRRQAEIMIGLGIDTLDKFRNVTVDQLLALPGFSEGGSKAPGIVKGIKDAAPLIDGLLATGVSIVKEEQAAPIEPTSGKLKGSCFCFTGKINKEDKDGNRFTRKMMWDTCLEHGGTYSEDVRPGVTHLVQADPSSQSSKTKKALKIGIEIISEKYFFEMVE